MGSTGGVALGDTGPGREAGVPKLPPVRLAPRDELAAAARVAPLLRAAREVARWAGAGRMVGGGEQMPAEEAGLAASELELTPTELEAAWRVAAGTGMLRVDSPRAAPGGSIDVLTDGSTDEVLGIWERALSLMLAADDLDGMATALYTVAGPVRMEALFEAYAAAAGPGSGRAGRASGTAGPPGAAGEGSGRDGTTKDGTTKDGTARDGTERDGTGEDGAGADCAAGDGGRDSHDADQDSRSVDRDSRSVDRDSHDGDQAAELSTALEALADLGVVELGTEEAGGGLTVSLSRLGIWGMHRHLREQGWHVPVLGGGDSRGDAAALLATLASCDIEDGEAEISAWLASRAPGQAARELIDAARNGTPGLRGAGFAVLDRIGEDAVPAVRAALGDPVVRAHAAVWLHEHGEEAELGPRDRAWLLVDLGAGLLEEADPRDVVAELLPDLPPGAQADLVAGLWEVRHPAVTDLLTALSDHHPDPAVARAARKAAFKARSPSGRTRRRRSGRPAGS
jgi:hypothetical protein